MGVGPGQLRTAKWKALEEAFKWCRDPALQS